MSIDFTNMFYAQTILWLICGVVCCICFIIQLLVMLNKFNSIKSIRRTYLSSILAHFGYIMFFICALYQHLYSSSCTCSISNKIVSFFYDFGKWNMWWFFICRAELTQGMMPIIPITIFRKYGPIMLISTFIFTYLMQVFFMQFECADSDQIDTYCIWTVSPIWLGLLGTSLELTNVIVFTSLFIIPLWKLNLVGIMNKNDTGISENQFRTELKWNITLTLIATISSLIFLISISIPWLLSIWWIFVAIDNVTNSLCCFLMMKPNIKYVVTKLGIVDDIDIKAVMDSTNVNNHGLDSKSMSTPVSP
eukprot:311792_1